MADTRANQEIEDLSAIDAEEHAPDEWERLIRAMRSGDTAIVSESVGSYFLGVLPPRWFPGNGSFAFCEGDDRYTLFVAADGRWLMRTVEYGERSASVLRDRVHEMRAAFDQHRGAQGSAE